MTEDRNNLTGENTGANEHQSEDFPARVGPTGEVVTAAWPLVDGTQLFGSDDIAFLRQLGIAA